MQQRRNQQETSRRGDSRGEDNYSRRSHGTSYSEIPTRNARNWGSTNDYSDEDYGSNVSENNTWNTRAARPSYSSYSDSDADYSYDQRVSGSRGGSVSFQNRGGRSFGQGGDQDYQDDNYNRSFQRGSYEGPAYSDKPYYDQSYGRGATSYGQGSNYNQSKPYTTQRSWNEGANYGQAGQQNQTGRYSGMGPKGYTRSDDRLKEEICEMLTRHSDIDATDIEVEVSNGEVTLSGNVSEKSMKRTAEDIADQCYGVKDVHNEIKVKKADEDMGMSAGSTKSSNTSTSGKKSSSSSKSLR